MGMKLQIAFLLFGALSSCLCLYSEGRPKFFVVLASCHVVKKKLSHQLRQIQTN